MTPTGKEPVILVVDDSPDSLGMINSALDQAGFTVLVALNGRQALDIVERITPDVVLMDAVMPVMDGFDCCRAMRELLPLTPIIFMTGLTDPEHAVHAFEAGGNDYVTKPINPAELMARIDTHLVQADKLHIACSALDAVHQHVLAVDDRGNLMWATSKARQLLAHLEAPTDEGEALRQALRHWLQSPTTDRNLVIPAPDGPLVFQYIKPTHGGEHLLRIVRRDLLQDPGALEAALPLTRREAEVLLWVARGKTNKEIGEILSLSPRTVNKHLEQIYPKLHVDNRAAAKTVAIPTLLGLNTPL